MKNKEIAKSPEKINVREIIIEKIMACGYDMFTACSEATRIISEFKASGKKETTVGIMGSFGKCADTITLRRKN